jgi:hypothetical protein
MSGAFSQPFCSVVSCGAGGRVITGRRLAACLVQVGGGELVLVHGPSAVVARAPAVTVQIVTPPTAADFSRPGQETALPQPGAR